TPRHGPQSGKKRRPHVGGSSTNPSHTAKVTKKKAKLSAAQFACPFWKKDARRYRDCCKGISRIRDVKQHLYRKHMLPSRCFICGSIFSSQIELFEHQQSAQPCPRRSLPPIDGLSL